MDADCLHPVVGVVRKIPFTTTIIQCACGCGAERESLDKQMRPRRFMVGHHTKVLALTLTCLCEICGESFHRPRSAKTFRFCSRQCCATSQRTGLYHKHVGIAEKAIGHRLPPAAEVHHFDENRFNNSTSNLVICENRQYHHLLHRRRRAYLACGDPSKRKCWVCQTYDDPSNMYLHLDGRRAYHTSCVVANNRLSLARRKGGSSNVT